MNLKMNHAKLKEKMSTPDGWNINELISYCISFGYVDDIKKILMDYPTYKYDYVSYLDSMMLNADNNTKIFKLIEHLIDWKNFHTVESFGSNTLKGLAFSATDNEKVSLNKINLFKMILDKCTITQDVEDSLRYTNWRVEDFVVKFKNHIIKNKDLFWSGKDWVNNIKDAKVYETLYHAKHHGNKIKTSYFNEYVPIEKGA
jgi:hypothetical protein